MTGSLLVHDWYLKDWYGVPYDSIDYVNTASSSGSKYNTESKAIIQNQMIAYTY